MKSIFDYAVSVAIVFGLIAFLFYTFLASVAIPDVHVSYETGDCVKVLNYVEEDKYSCENMPSKYNHVWVK